MARQVSQSSVSRSHTNSNANWWDIHANPISSWNSWQHQKLMDTNSAGISTDGGASSFPNESNNSGGDPTALLWNHVLLNEGDVHKNQGDDDPSQNFNSLETLSSKNLAADMFGGPACDYLRQLDESWELAAPVPFPTATATAVTNTAGKLIDRESSTKLSDLVSNWSIAPPQPGFDHHLHASATTDCLTKHIELQNSSPYSSCSYSELSGGSITGDAGMLAFGYGDDDDTRLIQHHHHHLHAVGLGNSISEFSDRYAASDAPWSNTRNFTDLINFGGSVSNNSTKQLVRVDQLDSSSTHSRKETKKIIGVGNVKEKKKKRSDKSADGVLKKCKKHETMSSSNLSSTKIQIPRVKLGEKITALQQMVSPFGKTDTASVLMEAINYIKFLHEQVQLLSQDPFTKSGSAKNLRSWGGPGCKDKNEIKLDLGNRGLCLVPISSTRQIYGSENLNGPDCWTPNYRGFLYR